MCNGVPAVLCGGNHHDVVHRRIPREAGWQTACLHLQGGGRGGGLSPGVAHGYTGRIIVVVVVVVSSSSSSSSSCRYCVVVYLPFFFLPLFLPCLLLRSIFHNVSALPGGWVAEW